MHFALGEILIALLVFIIPIFVAKADGQGDMVAQSAQSSFQPSSSNQSK